MIEKKDNMLYHVIDMDNINEELWFTSLQRVANYIGAYRNALEISLYKSHTYKNRWVVELEDGSEVLYKNINKSKV